MTSRKIVRALNLQLNQPIDKIKNNSEEKKRKSKKEERENQMSLYKHANLWFNYRCNYFAKDNAIAIRDK